jgi:hypothetical protein
MSDYNVQRIPNGLDASSAEGQLLIRQRIDRVRDLRAHNREMLKLRSNGQAYRDRLVRERLNLRKADV